MGHNDDHARVFVALALEPALAQRLAVAAEEALGGSAARREFRLAHGAGLHLTLQFLAEREPFHPHVTVARPRRSRVRVPEAFTRLRFELPWEPVEVVLLESVARPGGNLYEPRARCALRGRGAKPS